MKTTVEIRDALLEEAKSVTIDQGVTLRELIEAGLQRELEMRMERNTFQLRDASFMGDGLRPGLSWEDWELIRDASYEGRGA